MQRAQNRDVKSQWAGVRAFMVVLLVGTYLIVGQAQRSDAISCPANIDRFATQSLGATSQYGAQVARMLVVNPPSDCELMRSLYIQKDGSNWVEVGWYKDGQFASLDKCSNTTTPHILVYAVVNSSTIKCKPDTPALNPGQEYSFRVDNPDHDQDFTYYWDSDQTPSISLGYYSTSQTKGYPQASDERRTSSADSLRAEFWYTESLGSGGGWHGFPSATLEDYGDTSGWDVCAWSGNSLIVKSNGAC
jgi:hypothetical protein